MLRYNLFYPKVNSFILSGFLKYGRLDVSIFYTSRWNTFLLYYLPGQQRSIQLTHLWLRGQNSTLLSNSEAKNK